jgi:hypothetical protein
MPAAVELELAAGEDVEGGAGDDAVELLAGAEDVGGAGEDDGEPVVPEERHQVEVAGGAGGGVGGAGVVGGVLGDVAGAAAVDLGGGDVDVAADEVEFRRRRSWRRTLATTLVWYQWSGWSQLSATMLWAAKLMT